ADFKDVGGRTAHCGIESYRDDQGFNARRWDEGFADCWDYEEQHEDDGFDVFSCRNLHRGDAGFWKSRVSARMAFAGASLPFEGSSAWFTEEVDDSDMGDFCDGLLVFIEEAPGDRETSLRGHGPRPRFQNLPGDMAFWDYLAMKRLGKTKVELSVSSEWSPDERYFLTATTAQRL
ncbi:eukaryotic translation initiation factor 2A, partial [Striga asiatica]